MSKLKITGILEKDKVILKESHQFRVGRVGTIGNLNIGTPLYFTYEMNCRTFVTTNVIDYQEDDYGVLIETKNTVYSLDYVYDNNNDEVDILE